MQEIISKLPEHLKKYVVDQNYSKYSSEDQAIWRYIIRQLKKHLKTHGHPAYMGGLEKTGVTEDKIPDISHMNQKLSEFGWGAVPISGFIPPVAFMEFQSLSILPIASDLRTLDHIQYTPAPDIVHESAGHAPILVDPKFASYLKQYATIASKAIYCQKDLEIYDAIRDLSDIKENPNSTAEQVEACEEALNKKSAASGILSEAALLARMNWWTAEYGLFGSLDNPKIFGAGLLSSIGEAHSCLKSHVKKIPLSTDCIKYSYDITEPQPQLFVTPSFENLTQVLLELSETMAYKRGGLYGLNKALESQTINTIVLDTGLQISGVLSQFENNAKAPESIEFFKFEGPTQLSYRNCELNGHGIKYHSHGFSSPLGPLKNINKELSELNSSDLELLGLFNGNCATLNFESGIDVKGQVNGLLSENNKLLLITFDNCTVSKGTDVLFQPEWGTFDLAVGQSIASVFGGPADRVKYGQTIDFIPQFIDEKQPTAEENLLRQFYFDVRQLREEGISKTTSSNKLSGMIAHWADQFSNQWLLGVELYELSIKNSGNQTHTELLKTHLIEAYQANPKLKTLIDGGLQLANEETQL